MRFWIRELLGWGLMALGLVMFFQAYAMLGQRMVWEAGQWSVVGLVVFRGGIHLLKVAVAARVCMAAVNDPSGEKRGAPVLRPGGQRPTTLPRAGITKSRAG